jgi:hypothetical protein
MIRKSVRPCVIGSILMVSGVRSPDGGINGLAALDGSAFDLMIVDVFMPNVRGFE